jgi:SPP1 family predicted phage head-tail adaptor
VSIRSKVFAQRLDQRVVLQRAVESQDPGTGEVSVSWQTVATLWASVDGLKANERYSLNEVTSNRAYTVWVRWRADIRQKDRLVWGSCVLEIVDVPNQQRRGRLLSLFCTEGLTEG